MIRLLLVNPAFYASHPPLGLAFLAAYVKKYSTYPLEIRIADEAAGDSVPQIVDGFQPHLVGITVVTPVYADVRRLCQCVRDRCGATIVVGGPHVTAMPESVPELGADIGVMGEGEETLLELVTCYAMSGIAQHERIAGIVYPLDGRLVRTKERELLADLDRIPPPDRSLLNMRFYTRPGRLAHGFYGKGTSMMVSRGCPLGKCDFCSSHLMWRNKVRFFSPERVATEMAELIEAWGLNALIMLDDNFTTNVKWLQALLAILQAQGLAQRVAFDCETISFMLDDQRAELLRQLGCRRVELGTESGVERVLARLKCGRVTVRQNEEAVRVAKRHGLLILGNVIFGYPDETSAEMEQSAAWFRALDLDVVAAHMYTPYPGTAGWKNCVAGGMLDPARMPWATFATGATVSNIVVNQEMTRDAFVEHFSRLSREFDRAARNLVVDRALGARERLQLWAGAVRDAQGSRFVRAPDLCRPLVALAGSNRALQVASRVTWRMGRAAKTLGVHARHGHWRAIVWEVWRRMVTHRSLCARLPWGDLFRAYPDVIGGHAWQRRRFDPDVESFMARFVQPGMFAVEAGAHQGYFTLLLSRRVGVAGRVLAFEPSPRERGRLLGNLALNGRTNVVVEADALAAVAGEEKLYVCAYETGCNSLRPPTVGEKTETVAVHAVTLDAALAHAQWQKLDFIKLDAEGAELSILRGAEHTLSACRPVIICEMVDERTAPWGYYAADIYDLLMDHRYHWFSVDARGVLRSCPRKNAFHENMVAVPDDRCDALGHTIGEG